jgi:adenosylcobinamide-phosphate synthase
VIAAVMLALAAAIDALFGEPPNALHPVVWMGNAISVGKRLAPRAGRGAPFVAGVALAAIVPSVFAAAAYGAERALRGHPWVWLVVGAWLLKTTFSLRALGAAARRMRDALSSGDLAGARHGLRSLCSRDPSALDEPLLAAATIESIAENASDSVVAPVLWFAIFGLPGAVFYRAVNTLDAMIGYHGEYEWLGKASARLDDALNWVPARLTAALLLAAGAACGLDARAGWRVLSRDGARTESPNAGRPMSAMAGLLGVSLVKPGCYALGDAREAMGPGKIDEAWRVVRGGAWIALAGAIAAIGAIHAR